MFVSALFGGLLRTVLVVCLCAGASYSLKRNDRTCLQFCLFFAREAVSSYVALDRRLL